MPQKPTRLLTLSLLALFIAAGTLGCPSDDDEPTNDVGIEDATDDEDVSDEDTDPPADPEGQLSFDYENGISGQFSVTGNPVFSSGDMPDLDTFVLAMLEEEDDDSETLIIGAADPIDGEHLDAFLIMVPDFEAELATLPFDPDCMEIADPECAVGGFFRNVPYADFAGGPDDWTQSAEEVYVIASGDFDLTTFPVAFDPDDFNVVAGMFTGTAPLFFANGELYDGDPVTLEITSGVFEAGLLVFE